MKSRVQRDGSTVKITVEDVGSKQADLLKEFTECAEGRCSCPTTQYEKVASMQIAPGKNRLSIMLTAKPGEIIETGMTSTRASNTRRGR